MAFIVLPFIASADPVGPGGDPDATPIDGGISLLVAAGVGYGAKKLHSARKKKAAQHDDAVEK